MVFGWEDRGTDAGPSLPISTPHQETRRGRALAYEHHIFQDLIILGHIVTLRRFCSVIPRVERV